MPGIPKVGETASLSKRVTAEDIAAFGKLVGDRNPIHFDTEFARNSRFKRTVAHGMLGASLISAVLGMQLPGPGTIYLRQTLEFRAPIYPGDTVTAIVTVTAVREDKPILTLRTTCSNQEGALLIEGEAVVLLERPGERR